MNKLSNTELVQYGILIGKGRTRKQAYKMIMLAKDKKKTRLIDCPKGHHYCVTCERAFGWHGIGKHQLMHKAKKESCIIIDSKEIEYKYYFDKGLWVKELVS